MEPKIDVSPFIVIAQNSILRITHRAPKAGANFSVIVQILNIVNEIQVIQQTITTSSAYSTQNDLVKLPKCTLLSVTIMSSDAAVSPGQSLFTVRLVQGTTDANNFTVRVLLFGFVASFIPLIYPYQTSNISYPDNFYIRNIDFTPTITSEVATLTLPVRNTTLLEGVYINFTTDANVANRLLWLEVIISSSVSFVILPTVTQAASLSYQYAFVPGVNSEINKNTFVTNELPPVHVYDGCTIKIHIDNAQAGDDITLARIVGKSGNSLSTLGHS